MSRPTDVPSRNWWKAMDKMLSKKKMPDVVRDLAGKEHLIGGSLQTFIKWAALERMNFEADIDDEIKTFLEKRKRLYQINYKEWKRIRISVFSRDNFTCTYCGTVGGRLEIDHIVPFSKMGSDAESNLTTACFKCNRSKRDKTLTEFQNILNAKQNTQGLD